MAYADTDGGPDTPVRVFDIEQLVAPGEIAARPLLPSLRYHPAPGELPVRDIRLPWADRESDEPPGSGPAAGSGSGPVHESVHESVSSPGPAEVSAAAPDAVLGQLARELGSRVPGRLVASAKSWLSHPAVDRTAPILPWGAPDEVPRVSPLAASASYLAHVRAAWNRAFPAHRLEGQEIVLTVPASFDEAARALTVEAARLAGLDQARLVEEPQAACYDWLARHRDDAAALPEDLRLLLVCDVGGGTTDLTLIQIEPTAAGPRLTRIGVGEHLMLGGDNMDLALAHVAEGRLATESGARLGSAQLSQLVQQCRTAKERLLEADGPERASVTVLGAGARLIGAARSTELTRDEVRHMVLEGFFPPAAAEERPRRTRGALVEFGLPYAADPAITRHLAAFLAQHAPAARQALGVAAPDSGFSSMPDAVLLNGGVFRSGMLAGRLLDQLTAWRGAPLHQLVNGDPELAVARGAVAYAMARRGWGRTIGGGAARSLFLLLDATQQGRPRGVCVLPRGTEEGHELRLTERSFALRLGQPVQFRLAASPADAPCRPGAVVTLDADTLHFLPPLETVVGARDGASRTREVRVQLVATPTEIGTLALACVAEDDERRRWKLEFQLRAGTEAPRSPNDASTAAGAMTPVGEAHPRISEAAARIERCYGSRSQQVDPREVRGLRGALEKILGPRDDWPIPLLRELFEPLWAGARRRRRSADHERQWFNLMGFCLRPGYGYPLDEWRVEQLWSLYPQGVQFVPEARVWAEWWTLWRRISGGLDALAQETLLEDMAWYLTPLGPTPPKKPPGPKKQGYDDMVRLVGGLERLSIARKVEVGGWLLERLRRPGESPQGWWAVGRLGARVPFYGSAHAVIPPEIAADWLQQVLDLDWKTVRPAAFAATMLSRMSGDRARDLPAAQRAEVAQRLRLAKAPEVWVAMVEAITELDRAAEQQVFGESLPAGLRLVH